LQATGCNTSQMTLVLHATGCLASQLHVLQSTPVLQARGYNTSQMTLILQARSWRAADCLANSALTRQPEATCPTNTAPGNMLPSHVPNLKALRATKETNSRNSAACAAPHALPARLLQA
jgi:hypothetical protein